MYTQVAFLVGAVTSTVAGYIGMKIAVNANGRVAVRAAQAGVCGTVGKWCLL